MSRFKRILLLGVFGVAVILSGCQNQESEEKNKADHQETGNKKESMEKTKKDRRKKMRIQIESNGKRMVFELNNSRAARDLYAQLPLTAENEDFSTNEKTFYPPKKLDAANAPHTDGSVGTLAYYEPWGDVVIFYDTYRSNDALYELGKISFGNENMKNISGEMVISGLED